MLTWILRIATLAGLVVAANAQGVQGCALGRGGGTDGVTDGCYGSVSVDYEVDSPLHATGRVRFTDATGSSAWVAATPHATEGTTDSQTATTSNERGETGGTYRISRGTVQKRNDAGRWIDQAPRKKPDADDMAALQSAYLGAGGALPWQTLAVAPESASYDGTSYEPLRATPGGTAGGAPFALGFASGVGWCFLAPGDSCDGLAVVVLGPGEGEGTVPRTADLASLPQAWTFWEWLQ